jgi:hypothetical protein
MWLFKKREKNAASETKNNVSDKVAGKIARAGLKLQAVFGNKMNKLFEKMNIKRLKWLLGIFIVCAGGYSMYLLISAIVKPADTTLKIEQVDIPRHFNKTGEETITSEAYVDEETFSNIQGFKKYMDSIKQVNGKQYDSILFTRPGLLDSVQMLEEIYHSQKK